MKFIAVLIAVTAAVLITVHYRAYRFARSIQQTVSRNQTTDPQHVTTREDRP